VERKQSDHHRHGHWVGTADGTADRRDARRQDLVRQQGGVGSAFHFSMPMQSNTVIPPEEDAKTPVVEKAA
jgi:hypothetical protein